MKKATGMMFLLLSMIVFSGCDSDACDAAIGEEICDAIVVEVVTTRVDTF